MLGYFPVPYPDELFYSVCARLSDHLGNPDWSHVALDLFRAPEAMIVLTYPAILIESSRHFRPVTV